MLALGSGHSGCGRRPRRVNWQSNSKQSTPAGSALGLNVAAVCLSNPTTDGEPEPCPSGFTRAGLIRPVEPLEHVRQVGIADPDAVVPYGDNRGAMRELT